MEKLLDFFKPWFSKNTPRGRAVRTFIQVFAGFNLLLGAIVALPQFKEFMEMIGLGGQVAAMSLFIASLSRLQSFIEENYKKITIWLFGDDI